jgi:hypothetical protein
MADDANTIKTVDLLATLAGLDTVYRDIYLGRARQILSSVLDESAYRAIGSSQTEINDLVARSRSAVWRRDWQEAAELSARIAGVREHVAAKEPLRKIGAAVYDADAIAFDPFSPGKHLGPNAVTNQAELRAEVVGALSALVKLDNGAAAFYESRKKYFSGLDLASTAPAAKQSQQRDRAQAERLAAAAAENGDAALLARLAKELCEWKESGPAVTSSAPPALLNRYDCPVNLTAGFGAETIERARAFGFVEACTAPMQEFQKIRNILYTHIDQPTTSNADSEREGVLRAQAEVETQLPAVLATEEARVLTSQFLQQIFVNSGGARYLPLLGGDTALVEDFPENESADRPSDLLKALGLGKRSGRSRLEIERAFMSRGKSILEKDLGLDPLEFRLACIPYDLYTRFGRERGLGKWPHWTHFDGYQVMAANRLRALVGGDGRFGGLYDLVSISPSDARDGVYARFAVVRRARMTLRWH